MMRNRPARTSRRAPARLPTARQIAAVDAQNRPGLMGTPADGLNSNEVQRRLQDFGPNAPRRFRGSSWLARLAANFVHRLALLLWTSAGLAFAAGITELGLAIVAVIAVNGFFSYFQEYRADKVVEGLMAQVAVRSTVRRDGTWQTVPAVDLVPGDLVRVSAGDLVPADIALIEAEGLTVDLSALTGESVPSERSAEAGSAPSLPVAELPSVVPAGAGVVTGTGVGLVFATGPSSTSGHMTELVASMQRGTSLLERQVGVLSATTATVAVLLGAGTLVLATLFTSTSFEAALIFSTGVIVALVPEGLLPTLNMSLAVGARRMASRGAAVRRLSAVEVIGSATVICTDKTGTLTQNSLEVASIAVRPTPAMDPERVIALALGLPDQGPIDALDRALLARLSPRSYAAEALGGWRLVDFKPFDARVRYSAVTFDSDSGVWRFLKGAPEAVLAQCSTPELPNELTTAEAGATALGHRVVLVAAGPVAEVVPYALVAFRDPPRPGVAAAIRSCESAGVRIIMLTGDHPETARSLGISVGLADADTPILLGTELDRMSNAALLRNLEGHAILARIDPEQKLRVVEALRAAGEVVVVTGDGINDAPALRAADVGVAMGLRGTEIAKQAADFVLADDNFVTIVAAIEEGRSIRANIRRFISYVFTSNVAEVAPFLVYIFFPVPLPLAIMQALAIDLGTDLLPALALGTEPPAKGTMQRPAEPPSEPLLTRRLGALTLFWFGALEAALGLGGFFAYYIVEGWRPFESLDGSEGVHLPATTVTFLAIVGGQVGCLFAQRTGSFRERFSRGENTWIVWGLAAELGFALLLLYMPGLNSAFSTVAINPIWLLAVPAAAAVFTLADGARRVLSNPRKGLR